MEELEIHSKSFLIRWINVQPKHTISWSIQPHKKSLNFGIFKHPGRLDNLSTHVGTDALSDLTKENGKTSGLPPGPNITERLKLIGLKPVFWAGKYEADKISQGYHDVEDEDGGNYAMVFDNTFSKQISKTVTFVLLTYPTSTPPLSYHHIGHRGSQSRRQSSAQRPSTAGSGAATTSTPALNRTEHETVSEPPATHSGILLKRRRKRHQGFARRFFSLDYNTSTLSYYHDRHSAALRGAMPLTLAAIAANENSREISLDTGAEVWHLRATTPSDFSRWKRALEKAGKDALAPAGVTLTEPGSNGPSPHPTDRSSFDDSLQCKRISDVLSKVTQSRETLCKMARDTDPRYMGDLPERPGRATSPSSASRLAVPSPSAENLPSTSTTEAGSEPSSQRRSFWKIRSRDRDLGSSTPNSLSLNSKSRRSVSSQLSPVPSQTTFTPHLVAEPPSIDGSLRSELLDVSDTLGDVAANLSKLLQDRKSRSSDLKSLSSRRVSLESDDASQEFFDALDSKDSPLFELKNDSSSDNGDGQDGERAGTEHDAKAEVDDDENLSDSESEVEDAEEEASHLHFDTSSSLFPDKPRSLEPLPLEMVPRRTQIKSPNFSPPSLIGFLRKNIGKDLSSIAMPVSANEPLSLLQKAAEQFEYTHLLDQAAATTNPIERLIFVTAFAISPLSSSRIKERSQRKPFNPMLGETFEMVREDRGFRFMAEKVSHKPVQLALQADAKDWSITQSPKPSQQFWGKSAEIIAEGKFRLVLHTTGDHFSWTAATCALRNIIAGEKYVEPTGQMIVVNETTGQKTVTTFKSPGVFSGRSEELTTKAFDTHGQLLPLGLQGTWTHDLKLTERDSVTDTTIWKVANLVKDSPKHYGFTEFAASLSEITAIEKAHLPPTDSRLRVDRRALEEGAVDRAEELKFQLEDLQRERRGEMETKGQTWTPKWFVKADNTTSETVWKMKTMRDGYWEERSAGKWAVLPPQSEIYFPCEFQYQA